MVDMITSSTGQAKNMAEEYGLPYVDLSSFRLDMDLFRSIPMDWMLKYQFIPESDRDGVLTLIVGDPGNLPMWDEVELLLGRPIRLKVADRDGIREYLEKSESSQRVLDEATEDFRMHLVQDTEDGEETLSIDRITTESSPIIRLVDSR